MVNILLADDNRRMLDHVRGLLERNSEFNIVGTVTDGAAALSETRRKRPDIIVLDISFGDISGIDVATELRDAGFLTKIVFLTVHEDPDFLHAAMGAGGSGYVVKSRISSDLVLAIEAALAQKVFVSPNMLYKDHSKSTQAH